MPTTTQARAWNSNSPKVIRDPAFAKRFEQAADMHPHCPPKGSGRLGWVVTELKKRGVTATNESVRKWFAGEQKPRPNKGEVLAEILEVDPAWLMMGHDPAITPRDRKVRNAMVDGAVNVVAGLIQMDGGHPAFPLDTDKQAQREYVDLYAVIRGANYALNIALGETEGRSATFAVPTGVGENVIVIGLIRDGMHFDLFELTPEIIQEFGQRHGGSTEITVDGSKLRRIDGFTQRL